MRVDYQFFINDKELLVNRYTYNLIIKYGSDSRKYTIDFRIANCLKLEIDEKLFTAIARYGYERQDTDMRWKCSIKEEKYVVKI